MTDTAYGWHDEVGAQSELIRGDGGAAGGGSSTTGSGYDLAAPTQAIEAPQVFDVIGSDPILVAAPAQERSGGGGIVANAPRPPTGDAAPAATPSAPTEAATERRGTTGALQASPASTGTLGAGAIGAGVLALSLALLLLIAVVRDEE